MGYYMTTAQQIVALRGLGLPYATAAQRRSSWKLYQAAATWGNKLDEDGLPGPLTKASVATAKRHGYRVSKHFHLSEFRCGCKGRYHHKHYVEVKRALIESLEKARSKVYGGRPLAITSGWRCRQFNRAIGGLDDGKYISAHCLGIAADVPRKAGPQAFYGLGFRGIGYRSHGLVTHVDQAPWLRPNNQFKE